MNIDSSIDEAKVASELYFLIAKFFSKGPLKETSEVLRQELEKHKILPKRLDWEGNVHDQTFDELQTQHPCVSSDHLLQVCSTLLKKFAEKPRKSLFCTSIFCPSPPKKKHNVLDRIMLRESGECKERVLPASLYGSLQLQRITLGHLSAVYCVLFDSSGHYIITGADDLLVKIWSSVDGRLLGTLRGASAEISDMALDAENSLLAAGSLDKLIRVWDLQTAAPVAVLQGHSGMITSVHFCPAKSGDLSCLVSTSTDGSVAFWTYSRSSGGKPYFISKPVQYVERMRPGACQMICAAWSPGGAFLAAGSADHHVRVYMMAENGPKRILETAVHCDAVDSLQWAHTGLKFVSGSKDGTAILWQLHAMQWRHTKLNMTDMVPGEKSVSDESKKVKVTMVAWDCTDRYVITAVNDHSLKVWCSLTGKLIRVLRGHTDEIYVLESHPNHPAVLLSAGHDGQLFIWDILRGKSLGSFLNSIEGQGHGAIFDAKWCPDGSKIAATDSHGHLLMLGLGQGHPLLRDLPRELFFHTDYRPLVRDAQGAVTDEQTGVPPHLMPPPFLVDIEGAPHPPPLQRLVPGREHASLDQLVPDTAAVGEFQFGVEDNEDRLHIDYMIQALAMQYNIPDGDDPSLEHNRPRGEGVRNSVGEWQRGDPLMRSRRAIVAPLSHWVLEAKQLYIEEMTQMEMGWYRREMRRRPMMISTAGSGPADSRVTSGRGRRRAGAPQGPRKPPPMPRTYNSDPPEEVSSEDSDSDSSVCLSVVSPGYKASNTSSDSDSSEHFSKHKASSSSEYSDWVAEHPGVPLQPPKRSKRKPVARQRYSPHPPNRKSANSTNPMIPKADNKKEPQSGGSTSVVTNAEGHAPHIPELYRPSDWLCAVQPRKAPYHPQMGDECMYFKQGHLRYVDAVSEKDVYKITPRDKPWERLDLKECENVKVVGIKYMIRPPRLVCLKLMLDSGKHFTVRYHDMPDVLDFLVLKQTYQTAVQRRWTHGDRFRCMIDDGWWMGTIVEGEGIGAGHFLSLRVRWDDGEFERMSPWDLEPIDDTRLPLEVGGWVSVLPCELESVLYKPSEEEWPGGDRTAACEMIVKGLDQVLMLAMAEPFMAPVDLNVYPTYAYLIEYPIDLSTVKARFENHFYRRVTSAQFDVRYVATNAEKFNETHSPIVKQSRIITDLCLRVISNPFNIDVQACYHELVNSYQSSDSDEPLSKKSNVNGKLSIDWVAKCTKIVDGLFADSDSVPFREPVHSEEFPEYNHVIARPMDLGTVRQRLSTGKCSNPTQFASDVRLVFSNSKTYNTNKRSKIYSMTVRLESLFESLFKSIHKNWKAARRRSNKGTSNSWNDSQSEDETSVVVANGHSSAGNGFNGRASDADSWDSDVPLGNVKPYKGKGKGKKSLAIEVAPMRSSKRIHSEYLMNDDDDSQDGDPLQLENGDEEEEDIEEDSEDSYKPTRRDNGKDAFHRRTKKRGRRKNQAKNWKIGKRKYTMKNRKAKKRKRLNEDASDSGSSSDTAVSVASRQSGGRRYESDHSFQLKQPSATDSDTPLGNIRRGGTSYSNDGPSTSTSSRLRSNRLSNNSEESRAGPSGLRARRTARDSKKPRYNEDSEEDSIAAISKRLKAHQRPRANPITVQSRLQTMVVRPPQSQPSRPPVSVVVSQPSRSQQRPSTSMSNNTEDPADDEPLSVSSRGRIRKLTPKAGGFFRD